MLCVQVRPTIDSMIDCYADINPLDISRFSSLLDRPDLLRQLYVFFAFSGPSNYEGTSVCTEGTFLLPSS